MGSTSGGASCATGYDWTKSYNYSEQRRHLHLPGKLVGDEDLTTQRAQRKAAEDAETADECFAICSLARARKDFLRGVGRGRRKIVRELWVGLERVVGGGEGGRCAIFPC